jgi:deoxycytidylate deaminase
MVNSPQQASVSDGPELYIGLITPIGAPSNALVAAFEEELKRYEYTPVVIRISDLLRGHEPALKDDGKQCVDELMDRGNALCLEHGGDALARLAVDSLIEHRRRKRIAHSSPLLPRHAWIFRSLKRPEELNLLRRLYGQSFYSVALHVEYESRKKRLYYDLRATRPSLTDQEARNEARREIERDEEESEGGIEHGQSIRRIFPKADVIISGDDTAVMEKEVRRFVNILFGENITPTPGEHAMFLANASAALSASLSRKVGSCLTRPSGEIVAVGCNEVPKAGGGQYGTTDIVGRDMNLGVDYSSISVRELVAQTLRILESAGWLATERERQVRDDLDKLSIEAMRVFKDAKSRVLDLIEFQRSVHAEIAALLDAARRGVPTTGSLIFTTTYPCHLCTKEIVAAGVKKVIYIEPYPKSRAEAMYGAEILSTDASEGASKSVPFVPFVGVAPRAYERLFELEENEARDSLGRVKGVLLNKCLPKTGLTSPLANVVDREKQARLKL